MRISIHQPQYIPWIPYFSKIKESDLFIFLDDVDFQKNGLQNRNHIKSSQGKQWLTVPVLQKLNQKIIDVKIDNSCNWKYKHLQSLKLCYGKSLFFNNYLDDINFIYEQEWQSLCDLNIEIITTMLKWLKISTPIKRSSSSRLEGNGSNLILNICKKYKADTYISGIGGKSYLNIENFLDNKIKVL